MKDLFKVSGKVALVTGGSRGIGLMIARGFVEGGAKVYISARKREELEAARSELAKAGDVVAIPADLSTGQVAMRSRPRSRAVSQRFTCS
jgi:NAD(P)-dependent dehydrogenase (short-subunit alcohol dehydrogenase family)